MRFVVIGDHKSPATFDLPDADFFGVQAQLETSFRYAKLCPLDHYARKNIGYLLAIAAKTPRIIETDDDNFPREAFFVERCREQDVAMFKRPGWLNVYRHFTEACIWPRGLPLDHIHGELPEAVESAEKVTCPVQQGLADANPDVDAVYRLVFPLPQSFAEKRIALGRGVWCPFNSQNTTWWPEAYPLMYLPAYCSFRMTDIWRSFVAQRIMWENSWSLLFHEATVWQDRNEHNLMRDFADELPGYMHNDRISKTLEDLSLASGVAKIPDNLRQCYKALVSMDLVAREELALLDAWLEDLSDV